MQLIPRDRISKYRMASKMRILYRYIKRQEIIQLNLKEEYFSDYNEFS